MYTNTELAKRNQQIKERAEETLSEWLDERALEETAPLEILRAEHIANSLCGYFASMEMESEAERAKCWHAMEWALATSGGLVYVPELDGSPCITTRDQLRVMCGAESWADAQSVFNAVEL